MLPINQHYVPQFMLRNFSEGAKEHIHVYDKEGFKFFKTRVRNIAAERNFYNIGPVVDTGSIEPLFTQIESEAAKLIRKIAEEKTISFLVKEDKAFLAFFTALQFTRTRRHKENYIAIDRGLQEHVKKMGYDINQVKDYKPLTEESAQAAFLASIINDAPGFAEMINAKDIILHEAPKEIQFYISDHPVVLHNDNDYGPYGNLGLGVKGIQIFLPISPKLSLCFMCPSIGTSIKQTFTQIQYLMMNSPQSLKNLNVAKIIEFYESLTKGTPLKLQKENVIHHNSKQASQSYRFIFSKDGDFNLLQKMKASNHLKLGSLTFG